VNYLLDTNIVSEWTRARPNPGVLDWLSDIEEDRTFISVVTLAELRRGVARLPASRRQRSLDVWLAHDLRVRFDGRTFEIDSRIADAWGLVVADRDKAGRPISTIDAFLAATALVHDLAMVTHDAADFAGSVAVVIDPWKAGD
jgi:predicted nucleic acid-binding protein